MADTISLIHGPHDLKIGADLIYSTSGGIGQEFGSPFYLGQFTLVANVRKPFSDVTLQDVQRFSQGFGNASYHVTDWLGSVFLRDNWRVRPDLTLSLAVRYESQALTDDRGDIQPRFGFAWNVMTGAPSFVAVMRCTIRRFATTSRRVIASTGRKAFSPSQRRPASLDFRLHSRR